MLVRDRQSAPVPRDSGDRGFNAARVLFCMGADLSPSRDTRTMSQENVEKVRSCIDAWNRGDLDAFLADAHPEIEWSSEVARRVEGVDSVYRGIAGLRRFWDQFRSVWELTIDGLETRSVGDTVVALGHLRAHGETSGIELEQPITYVFEFDGGLARRVWGVLRPCRSPRSRRTVGVARGPKRRVQAGRAPFQDRAGLRSIRRRRTRRAALPPSAQRPSPPGRP